MRFAGGQDEGSALSLLWTDRAEDIGGSGPLIAGCMRTRATPGPPAPEKCSSLQCSKSFLNIDPSRHSATAIDAV
jgi:hypothetical protein